jgi:DNA-binding IclR family transcriptional regulator
MTGASADHAEAVCIVQYDVHIVHAMPAPPPYSSLRRGLAALEAIGDGERSISALAARLDLDRSAMSRLVTALEADGWVTRAADGPVLGPRAAVLGGSSVQRAAVHHVQTLVHLVAGITGCDVAVSVLSAGCGYQLATGIGRERLHEYPPIVEPFPLWATAGGQAMASMLSDDEAIALLPPEPLSRLAPNTLTSHDGVRARLAEIRARGWGLEQEEFCPGVACVAVPWTVPGYDLPAAMYCVGPLDHVRSRADRLERVLRAATSPGATESTILARAAR